MTKTSQIVARKRPDPNASRIGCGSSPGAVRNARADVKTVGGHAHELITHQRVHHQQAVASDEAVARVVRVFVELNRLPQRRVFPLGAKEGKLRVFLPFLIRTVSMMARGLIRSWTCRETVGTSKLVRSALPAQTSAGSRCGS